MKKLKEKTVFLGEAHPKGDGILWLLLSVVLFLGCSQEVGAERSSEEIRSLINRQLEDWNRGDIDAFMEGYWNNDSLRFVSSSGVIYGWESTLERYRKRYPDAAAMGTLTFEILQVDILAKDIASVTGKYLLERGIGNLDGLFSLVIRKLDGRWVIVSDHTS